MEEIRRVGNEEQLFLSLSTHCEISHMESEHELRMICSLFYSEAAIKTQRRRRGAGFSGRNKDAFASDTGRSKRSVQFASFKEEGSNNKDWGKTELENVVLSDSP